MTETLLTEIADGTGEARLEEDLGDRTEYAHLSSVWEGSDGDLLERMLRFYASIPPKPILDSTYNRGRFWKNSTRRVVSMDMNPKFETMIADDNREMAGIPDETFGAVVYDPPMSAPRDGARAESDSIRISTLR